MKTVKVGKKVAGTAEEIDLVSGWDVGIIEDIECEICKRKLFVSFSHVHRIIIRLVLDCTNHI